MHRWLPLEPSLGGLLSTTRGVVEVSSSGVVTLEIRKAKNLSYQHSLELFERVQTSFVPGTRIGTIYQDIETVAGKGLFVAQNNDAILIMRRVHTHVVTSRGDHMKRILDWWDAGRPMGAPLEALMKEVNDPLKPAVLQSKLDGNETCACCGAENGNGASLKQCAGCKIPFYCSKECQKSDWSSHKELCKATRQLAKINLM